MLRMEEVSKRYGALTVLDGVSLALEPGESVALTGESGSGKSTLLHLAGGLDHADQGRILLDGQEISAMGDKARAAIRRSHVGLVFQQFNLVPSLSVAQNISLQARLAGRADAEEVARLTNALGLEDLGQRFPEQLSGGQQQRVAIGRALAHRPRLILADEPTGNLDEDTAEAVLQVMLDLTRQSGAALLIATHSPQIAGHCDRRLHLSRGRLAAL